MRVKNFLLILGLVCFFLFFFLGIKSEFTHDSKQKVYLIFSSFFLLLIAFWFFILAKKEDY